MGPNNMHKDLPIFFSEVQMTHQRPCHHDDKKITEGCATWHEQFSERVDVLIKKSKTDKELRNILKNMIAWACFEGKEFVRKVFLQLGDRRIYTRWW
jgi:hypothetical protein